MHSGRATERTSLIDEGRHSTVFDRLSQAVDITKSSSEVQVGKASFFSTLVNMLNTTLGTAILSYARVYANAGIVWATIILTFCALLDFGTSYFMFLNSQAVGEPASMNKMAMALSPVAAVLLDICVILNCIGANVGFTIVSTDNLFAVFGGARWIWVLTFHALTAPLCYLRTLDSLRFTSLISLMLVGYIVVCVALFCAGIADPCPVNLHTNATSSSSLLDVCPAGSTAALPPEPMGVLRVLPTTTLSFAAEYAVPYYYNEMAQPTPGRMAGVIGLGHFLVWAIYLVVGLLGYLTFGSKTPSNILNAYPTNSQVANVARIGLALALVTSYPLVNLGVREAASKM